MTVEWPWPERDQNDLASRQLAAIEAVDLRASDRGPA